MRLLSWTPAEATQRLIDATVQLEGVSIAILHQKNQLIGIKLGVPGLEQLRIVEAPAGDPFELPVRSIGSLMGFTPQGNSQHRIRVQGTVTLERSRGLFIQEGNQGLFIPGHRTEVLKPGERVDVVGFADIGEYTPVLQQAIIRQIGSVSLPPPARVTAKQAMTGSLDAVRVLLDATLRDQRLSETNRELVLQDGDVLFEARIDQTKVSPGWPDLPSGSPIQLTGVCSASIGTAYQLPLPFS